MGEAYEWLRDRGSEAVDWLREEGNELLGKKWGCENVSCNVQQVDRDAQCPDRVYGNSDYKYKNFDDACNAAKQDANRRVPRGCYKRHCNCRNKCQQK
ncbi:MAG: hypothetical protein WA865_08055 [Spirulinaceae cyanobacterium]